MQLSQTSIRSIVSEKTYVSLFCRFYQFIDFLLNQWLGGFLTIIEYNIQGQSVEDFRPIV